MHRRFFLSSLTALAVAGCTTPGSVRLAPNTTLIVVRHSDRDGENLNAKGLERSRALVAALEGDPLDAIYSPSIQRNLDTAAPLSDARGLPIERRPQENPAPRLAREAVGRSVIWIGNKGNIQSIWDSFSLPQPAPLDYGDLFIARADANGRVTVERRRFGPE
ncbi:histidine phosphatase family protein [Marivita hallyeonensis]|uniref:Histidine phosphatase superfamily (Branch 1) n=1 Tax=Marivita hallyeonensis TaxID=996342 RepID=A0A1M5MHD8_9RHOB|nr:histidine phosphatase family protein [Marivita hallyeonensis]SHG76611.1 Histidine phosphatase superfamily (branch 1) [Marivita hallyeonensis]